MPNIRDLGISSIPVTARPMLASDGGESGYDAPTGPPLCECEPTSRPGCNPTSQPGCQPTNQPGCQPTSQPGCQPTSQPGCQPTNQPGCQPTNQPVGDPPSTCDPTSGPGYQTAMPSEVIAQLKQQLRHYISAEVRN